MESKKNTIFKCVIELRDKSKDLAERTNYTTLRDLNAGEVKKVDVFETQLLLIKIKAEIEVLDKCLDFEIERLNALGL